ncbi:MAG: flavin reductase family protein [Balneolaceae bacterium]
MSKESLHAKALKKVMRRIPYPVTIVTAAFENSRRGITIGSFTSLSLDPPLISFNVGKESQMHTLISQARHFAVHIPGADQADLCNHFALPDQTDSEQFYGIAADTHSLGIPLLKNVNAVLICKSDSLVDTGDHSIVIGEILEVQQMKKDPAILYLDGRYYELEEK